VLGRVFVRVFVCVFECACWLWRWRGQHAAPLQLTSHCCAAAAAAAAACVPHNKRTRLQTSPAACRPRWAAWCSCSSWTWRSTSWAARSARGSCARQATGCACCLSGAGGVGGVGGGGGVPVAVDTLLVALDMQLTACMARALQHDTACCAWRPLMRVARAPSHAGATTLAARSTCAIAPHCSWQTSRCGCARVRASCGAGSTRGPQQQ
jgi:hypothetical protein